MANIAILEGDSIFTCCNSPDLMGFSFKKAWRKTKRLAKKAGKKALMPARVVQRANRKVLQKTLGKRMYRKISSSPYVNPLKMSGVIVKKAKKYAKRAINKTIRPQLDRYIKGKGVSYLKRNKNAIADKVSLAVAGIVGGLVATTFPAVGAGLIPFIKISAKQAVKKTIDALIKSLSKIGKKAKRTAKKIVNRTQMKRWALPKSKWPKGMYQRPEERTSLPKSQWPKGMYQRPEEKKKINPLAIAIPALAVASFLL